MGVGDQHHAPAALPLGKHDPVPIAQEAGWAPGSVWTGAGFDPRTVQPRSVVAIPAAIYICTFHIFLPRLGWNAIQEMLAKILLKILFYFRKFSTDKAVLFRTADIKLRNLAYVKIILHSESNERLGETCVPVLSTSFAVRFSLAILLSYHQTNRLFLSAQTNLLWQSQPHILQGS
jgi:hypothetical protein